jgi:hypothetical protein
MTDRPRDPLPFRLSVPGRDTIGFEGIKSVSYRADGLLHLHDEGITLEWTETRTIDEVSLENIGTNVDASAADGLEVPMSRLAGAWVIGGWWWPRLELRARGLEDFQYVPGVRGVTLSLRIHRRDRELARAIAREIEAGVGEAGYDRQLQGP